jgi:N-methylhydantoinase B/oxoprolinase/acetone carboxylase alpha subunit
MNTDIRKILKRVNMTEINDLVKKIQDNKKEIRNNIDELESKLNQALYDLGVQTELPEFEISVDDKHIIIEFSGVHNRTGNCDEVITYNELSLIKDIVGGYTPNNFYIYSQSLGELVLEWKW